MTEVQFHNSFRFRSFFFSKYRHTDVSEGCECHFLARLMTGNARLVSAADTIELKAGDFFYIPKGLCYHSYWYPDETDALQFYSLGFDLFPLPEPPRFRLQVFRCSSAEEELFTSLTSDLGVNCNNVATLYRFLASVLPRLSVTPASQHPVLSLALTELEREPHLSVPQLAKRCGSSESGLYTLFKKHLGKTPVEMRHTFLLRQAENLLTTTDLGVEEISRILGFSSSSYFRKVMKKYTHTTPLSLRKQKQL